MTAMRVLMIEDNQADARLIETLVDRFQKNVISILHAPDLSSGLSRIDQDRVEALLLDLSLPDSEGLDTFLQVYEHSPNLPVVILTGTKNDEMALDAMRNGAQDYIVKGEIDAESLVRALRYAVERSRREHELEVVAQVSTAIQDALTQEQIINIAVSKISTVMGTQAAGIITVEEINQQKAFLIKGATGRWADFDETVMEAVGLGQEILDNQEPYVLIDAGESSDPRVEQMPIMHSVKNAAFVPLIANGVSIGIFGAGRDKLFDQYEINILQTVSNLVASAMQRAELLETSQVQVNRLKALRNIDTAIATSFNLDFTLEICLREVINQLNVDAASIYLIDNLNQLVAKANRGFKTAAFEKNQLNIQDSVAGQAVIQRRTLTYPDVTRDPLPFLKHPIQEKENFVMYGVAPMEVKGRVIGVLEVFSRSKFNPNQQWVDYFETLAGQAAIATHTAELFNEVQRSKIELEVAYDGTLEGWVRALDMRDHETEGHTQRVTNLTLQLARKAGHLSPAELIDIRRGALLHDIGKMAIPDEILNKPGALTDEEWVVMRAHTVYAKQFLEPIHYLRNAMTIPVCHHEKWDGSGYPEGLNGEEIPLAARIFAVVDVYDALTSDRPYRKAWTHEKAETYVEEQAGMHFDPNIVGEFLNLLGEIDKSS
jgi:response regulator RpfG family c-di-GMP phosphodiesterase